MSDSPARNRVVKPATASATDAPEGDPTSGPKATRERQSVELRAAIGARLADLRRVRGLTQEAAAAEAGRRKSWLAKLERGQRSLLFSEAIELAEVFGVPIAELWPGPLNSDVVRGLVLHRSVWLSHNDQPVLHVVVRKTEKGVVAQYAFTGSMARVGSSTRALDIEDPAAIDRAIELAIGELGLRRAQPLTDDDSG